MGIFFYTKGIFFYTTGIICYTKGIFCYTKGISFSTMGIFCYTKSILCYTLDISCYTLGGLWNASLGIGDNKFPMWPEPVSTVGYQWSSDPTAYAVNTEFADGHYCL